MAISKDYLKAMTNITQYYENSNMFFEKIMDFYQHNIEITEDHIIEIFTKYKMIDNELMDLIRTVDLRSYKNCPEYIKSMQNNYIQSIKNELNVLNKCPKSLINLTIRFFI